MPVKTHRGRVCRVDPIQKLGMMCLPEEAGSTIDWIDQRIYSLLLLLSFRGFR